MDRSSIRSLAPWLTLLTLPWLAGCLSHAYRIPDEELRRLASAPKEDRARRIRVVQQLSLESEPPPAPATDLDASWQIALAADVRVGHAHSRDHATRSRTVDVRPADARHEAAPPSAPRPRIHVSAQDGTARPGLPIEGGDDDDDDDDDETGDAEAMAIAAAVFAVVGAVAVVGLAASEGARYDGYVDLHPMHPVHLRLRDGSWAWSHLGDIDPQVAAQTDQAWVRDTEGPFTRVGRAPLNRAGLGFSFDIGPRSLLTSTNAAPVGYASHMRLGAYPVHQLGLLVDLGLGWGRDEANYAAFNLEVGGALEVYPLKAAWLEIGAYARAGLLRGTHDTPSGSVSVPWGSFVGGGLLIEADITTRLGLCLRGGVIAPNHDTLPGLLPEAALGLTVY